MKKVESWSACRKAKTDLQNLMINTELTTYTKWTTYKSELASTVDYEVLKLSS